MRKQNNEHRDNVTQQLQRRNDLLNELIILSEEQGELWQYHPDNKSRRSIEADYDNLNIRIDKILFELETLKSN